MAHAEFQENGVGYVTVYNNNGDKGGAQGNPLDRIIGVTGGADEDYFVVVDGKLYFRTPPDRESPAHDPIYSVFVTYQTKGKATHEVEVTVTVTDEREVGDNISLSGFNGSTLEIPENDAGRIAVATLAVTGDPDEQDSYTFATEDSRFEIDGVTLYLKAGNALNYEAENTVSVVVTATSENGSVEKTLTIKVADVNEAPEGITFSKEQTIVENSVSAVDRKVADLEVLDPDTQNETYRQHVFTVTDMNGVEDSRFYADSAGVYLNKGVSLNFESGATIALKVTAADDAGSVTETVVFNVGDINESGDDISLRGLGEGKAVEIIENVSAKTPVATLAVTGDPDKPDSYTFTTEDSRFEIDGVTLYLKAGNALNYEAENTVSVVVTAAGENGSVEKTLTIKVADVNEAPGDIIFSKEQTIVENSVSAVDRKVADLEVLDPDTQNETYRQHVFTVAGDPQNRFYADSAGVYLLANTSLDFESDHPIKLQVTATDAAGGVTKVVTINVANLNEAPTAVNDVGVMFEDTTDVFNVLLNDRDPDGDDLILIDVQLAAPGQGTVSFSEDGNIRFTPPANFTGDVFLSYKVAERGEREGREAGTSTGTLKIVVLDVAEPPVDNPPGGDPTGAEPPVGNPTDNGETPQPDPTDPDAPTPTPNDGFDGSIAAIVVTNFVEGVVPGSLGRLESLSNFADLQFLSYQERGVLRPELGPYEALGRGFAETNDFQDKYGALTESAFILQAYQDVFRRGATTDQQQHFQEQVDYFQEIYVWAKIPENHATLLAKGAVLGQMLGYAVLDEATTQHYFSQATAFLNDASDGEVELGKPLAFYELG